MSASQPNAPARLTVVDALRGLAALSVFVYHCLRLLTPNAYVIPFDFGEFGVVLFFLISGFVIALSTQRTGLLQFWVRRFFRLYPVYWFSIALALFLIWLVPNSTLALNYQSRPNGAVLLNLTMLQRLLGGLNYDLIPVYWTLFIEMLFYAIVTILILLRRFTQSVPLAIGAIVLASILEPLHGAHGAEPIHTTMYLAVMLTGTVLYRSTTGVISRRTLLGVSGLCMLMFLLIPTVPEIFAARVLALPLMGAALRLRVSPRPLVAFGQVSYSFYLVHEIVMGTIDTRVALLNAIIWFAVTLLVSAVAYRWIEYPAIRFARSSISRLFFRRMEQQEGQLTATSSVDPTT